jgi:tetratricopeptide (TPR) repeat protein
MVRTLISLLSVSSFFFLSTTAMAQDIASPSSAKPPLSQADIDRRVEALEQLSQDEMDRTAWKSAASTLTQLLSLPGQERNSHALYNRGLVYTELKEYKKAVTDFTAALAAGISEKDKFMVRNARATAYLKLGDEAQAIAEYNALLAPTPEQRIALYNRALAYARMRNWRHAIADADAILKVVSPDDPLFAQAAQLGESCRAMMASHPEGVDPLDAMNDAILKNPRDFEARYNRALLYLQMKKYDEAIAEMTKLFTFIPEVKDQGLLRDALYTRALAYMGKKDYAKAKDDVEELLKRNPKDIDAQSLRTDITAAQAAPAKSPAKPPVKSPARS